MSFPVPAAALLASLLAQAEPAPPEPAPAVAATPTGAPPNAIAVHARFASRLGGALGPAPASGFSFGATYERRYLRLGEVVALGALVDFFYDHFAKDVQNVTLTQQLLTQTSFAALQTVSFTLGPARPWLGAGAGVTVAYFSGSDAPGTGSTSARHLLPIARAALGLDVAIRPHQAIVLRADLTHPLSRGGVPTYGASPFGDLVDVGVGFLSRF